MGDLSEHFSRREFKCKCGKCDCDSIDTETLKLLETIRDHFNLPVKINSAHRCLDHNRSIGSKDDSQHVKARAADIVIDNITPEQIADYVESIMPDNGGIGIYTTFTHVDTRSNHARWRK